MLKNQFGLLLSIILLCTVLASAQGTSDETEQNERRAKVNALIEQAIVDIPNLRLPENRALFYAQAGDRLWSTDQKRSRELFNSAAAELITAQNPAEGQLKRTNPYSELLNGGGTRQQILNTIAAHDAEFALELLPKTRPSALLRAMSSTPDAPAKISDYNQSYRYMAQNERTLEQNLFRLAAEQNPDRALNLLKDSLGRGITNDTFNQLTRLADKDQEAASDMASDIMDRLLREKFATDGEINFANLQTARSLVDYSMSQRTAKETKLKLDPSRVRQLGSALVSAYLDNRSLSGYIGSPQQLAEQFAPGAVETVKKMVAYNQSSGSSSEQSEYQKLMQGDTPPETLIAAAEKMPKNYRRQIYETASQRYMARGNFDAARAVFGDNFSDQARDQMLANFDLQLTYRLINDSRFAEAEAVIDRLPEMQRIGPFVNLATTAFNKDKKENRTYALSILAQARDLIPMKPSNSSEMSGLMQLISAYSPIDADAAMSAYESLIPQMNELTDAAVVINGFQGNSNVRDGEFIMTQGEPLGGLGVGSYVLAGFANADMQRAAKMIDGFTRPEMRVFLRLQLAGSAISAVSIHNLPQGRAFSNVLTAY